MILHNLKNIVCSLSTLNFLEITKIPLHFFLFLWVGVGFFLGIDLQGKGKFDCAFTDIYTQMQLPATLHPGVTIVICPLLSLIQDQINALVFKFGIPATTLNSHQTPAQTSAVLQELRYLHVVGLILLHTQFIGPE
jgi:hypothetical protein